MTEIKQSEFPEESVNWDWEDNWEESEEICPECKSAYLWIAGWYDGSPWDGGARIGDQKTCGDCGYSDTF
jgi:hypothetical protein